jgi:iron complex transport system substrate-binding protein
VKSSIPFLLLLLSGCLSCSPKKGTLPQTSENDKDDIAHFSIHKNKDFRSIHVFNDLAHRDTLVSYVLYPSGSKKPSVDFPAIFVQTPVTRVACLSNIYVGCMARLGLTNKIVAVDQGKNICNGSIRQGVRDGSIVELNVGENLNIEKTLLVNPDLIFRFGTGNSSVDIPSLLQQSSIPVAISLDYKETNPLSRASWLRFVAAFFEKEMEADSILMHVKTNYHQLKEKASTVADRPRVFTEVMFKDVWYVPGGKSYMAALLQDAGADYLWKDDDHEGSLPLSYEAVYQKAAMADYWLNVQHWKSLSDAVNQDPRNRNFVAFQKGNLFNNDLQNTPEGAFAYWEKGLIAPDEVLADLISIFHPALLSNHPLTYYRKLN